MKKYFWGIDCGSTEIKIVVLDQSGKVLAKHKRRTLFPLMSHVSEAISETHINPFDKGQLSEEHSLVATGYGRHSISWATDRITEIKAHFLGVQAQLHLREPFTIVDIGGQDSKVISASPTKVLDFVINRKCAAGTGAYIEELAHRLEIKLADLAALESKHDKDLTLNSYCTVFAGQEVIKILVGGEKVENLIHALYVSVAKRVLEMWSFSHDTLVFSGGVMQYHQPLYRIFSEKLPGRKVILASEAQFCGALGAAQYALKHC